MRNNTISKLILDITDELNQYAEDRKRLYESTNNDFLMESRKVLDKQLISWQILLQNKEGGNK